MATTDELKGDRTEVSAKPVLDEQLSAGMEPPTEDMTTSDSATTRMSRVRALVPLGRKLAVVAGLLLAWHVWVRYFDVNRLLFPSPKAVWDELYEGIIGDGDLLEPTWRTLTTVAKAFGISIALGVLLTGFATLHAVGRDVLSTLTSIFRPLPGIAILPLAILWLGLNERSIIFVTVMSMVWPFASALTVGFATANETLVRVGRNYDLGRFGVLTKVLLPSALPSGIAGLSVAWSYGWRTVVGAELIFGMTGASGGLGWFINNQRVNLRVDAAIAGVTMVILVGLLVNGIFYLIQRRTTIRWGMERGANT